MTRATPAHGLPYHPTLQPEFPQPRLFEGNMLMPGQRFTLVADDHRLASAVLAHLKKSTGHASQILKYSEARGVLGRNRDETLVLLVASHAELLSARQLVQEICLLKLPFIVVVVSPEKTSEAVIVELEPHVSHVLIWPQDAGVLSQIVKNRTPRFRDSELDRFPPNSIEQRIARKLLAFTPSLFPLVDKLALAAQHDVTVLLTGETGTGKTFLARLIHEFSPRAAERFLTVSCGALAPNLVESELFGHVKGAFTSADRARVGKFAAAGNGTLLLDEIDALPLEQQANLLRVVETGEFEPVGSNETLKANCRLIVASNMNLKEEVDHNRFRQDLYYRFNVMSFHLPPLRERVQDIAPLVRGLAARFNSKFKKDLFDISSEAMAVLETYSWPGNVRELENALQHAVLVSQGPLLLTRHLPESIQEQTAKTVRSSPRPMETLMHNREVVERSVIQKALAAHGFSRARAAQELGISRVTLYKKMKKYGLLNEPTRRTIAQ